VVQPLRIILFGSAARGEMGPNSDLGVLVVMPDGVHRRKTAQQIYRNMWGSGFAKDIIVVTQGDVEKYRSDPDTIIKAALEEGRELYRAARQIGRCKRVNDGIPVQNKEQAIEVMQRQAARLRAFGVSRLGLFGSFVRQEQGADSDVDLLVEFAPGKKTFDNFIQLSFLLEDLFGRRVELVTPESLSPYIGPHIMQEVEYVALAA
jgi:predicted nucleotidyltransferase